MPKTVVRENEKIDDALRRFKRDVVDQELFKKLENANIIKSQA